MKVIHIQARLKAEFGLPDDFIAKLPNKVAVFTTIQLMNSLPKMVEQIEKSGREAVVFKTVHTRNKGQILGCNVQNFKKYADEDFEGFVYVGDGLFHPKALVWKNEDKKVFGFNPFTSEQYVIEGSDVEKTRRQYTAAKSLFIMAKRVGVLVTTKPGQFFLKKAFQLREEYPDKKFYFFIDNTINFGNLEDFPFIECWVNTACPRIPFEDQINISRPVVNLEDVKKENSFRAVSHRSGVLKK
jgi:2-(3-amino-3-carboxypropyl)histidine synthase